MTELIAPAIAAAYPFEEVTTVCDVGGGVGIVLAAALRHHAHLRGVLFDSHGMLGEAGGPTSRAAASPSASSSCQGASSTRCLAGPTPTC